MRKPAVSGWTDFCGFLFLNTAFSGYLGAPKWLMIFGVLSVALGLGLALVFFENDPAKHRWAIVQLIFSIAGISFFFV